MQHNDHDWLSRALDVAHLMRGAGVDHAAGNEADTLSRRQEKLDLIRILRDETISATVYARCVAIVGER